MPQYRGRPPATALALDRPARDKAAAWISDLAQDVAKVELKLATLGSFFDGDLAAAIVGAMGISAGEIREQIPALREALRDLDCDEPTPNNEVWG